MLPKRLQPQVRDLDLGKAVGEYLAEGPKAGKLPQGNFLGLGAPKRPKR